MLYEVCRKTPEGWEVVLQTYSRRDAYTEARYRRKFQDETTKVVSEVVLMDLVDPEPQHTLTILSLHDARAECSCGNWHYCATGEMTEQHIREEHHRHLEGRIPWDRHFPCGEVVSK
jgi:hypothetical protein